MNDTTVLWGGEHNEQLHHTDPDDAVEEILDNILRPGMSASEVRAVLPETVTIVGFRRMSIDPIPFARGVLEQLLESLDEEHADPDGGYNEPTEAMREASRDFVEAVLKEYVPWACEEAERQTITVLHWVQENRPDWLEI